MIYSIGLLGALDQDENPDVLKRLCKNTGGIAYFPGPSEHVRDISTKIARDLREQYTLGFSPEHTASAHSFRKIEVKVAVSGRGKLHVRSRPGYIGLAGSAGLGSAWEERVVNPRGRAGKKQRRTGALTIRGAFYFFLAAGILALGYAGYVVADTHVPIRQSNNRNSRA